VGYIEAENGTKRQEMGKKLFEGCRKILAKYYGHYLMTIGVKQTK